MIVLAVAKEVLYLICRERGRMAFGGYRRRRLCEGWQKGGLCETVLTTLIGLYLPFTPFKVRQ